MSHGFKFIRMQGSTCMVGWHIRHLGLQDVTAEMTEDPSFKATNPASHPPGSTERFLTVAAFS